MIRYAITDASREFSGRAERRAELLKSVRRWAEMGIEYIQLREKAVPSGELLELAEELMIELRQAGSRTRLLVNGRADVALAAGCHGVHLTAAEGELTPRQVRELYTWRGLPEPVISFSCHSPEEAARARDAGADLILFGPVFEKVVGGSSVQGGCGLEELAQAVRNAGAVPVLALGGVTAANAADCLAVGASGVAGIRLFG